MTAMNLSLYGLVLIFFLSTPARGQEITTTTVKGGLVVGASGVSTFSATAGPIESLVLSSGVALSSGVVGFPDGTTQRTVISAATNSVFISSQMLPNIFPEGQCLVGSTLTISLTGNSFMGIYFTGVVDDRTSNASIRVNALIDGEYLYGATSNLLVAGAADPTDFVNLSFMQIPERRFSIGDHTLCLVAYVITASDVVLLADSDWKAIFGAYEIQ